MAKPKKDFQCPHCSAMTIGPPEFCPSCGSRLTSVRPERFLHRVARVLGLVRTPPSEQQRAYAAQLYRKGPSNHGGEGGG